MRIVIIILLVLLVIGGWAIYQHHEQTIAFGNGTVTSQDSSSSDRSTDANLDGKPEASHDPTTDSQGIGSGRSTNQPPATSSSMASTSTLQTSSGTVASNSVIPVADSQTANAPDLSHFAGSGQYQWYRQGDLTWRIDTGTGATCIDFATMEEWKKPIVYRNGCHKS